MFCPPPAAPTPSCTTPLPSLSAALTPAPEMFPAWKVLHGFQLEPSGTGCPWPSQPLLRILPQRYSLGDAFFDGLLIPKARSSVPFDAPSNSISACTTIVTKFLVENPFFQRTFPVQSQFNGDRNQLSVSQDITSSPHSAWHTDFLSTKWVSELASLSLCFCTWQMIMMMMNS